MIFRTLVAVAALASLPLAAAAQDVGGRYQVNGTNFDGSAYRGTAEITVMSKNTCRISWDTGSTATGICMRNGDSFSAAYIMGKVMGLVIYRLNSDGSLEGLWTIADEDGVGTEVLTPR